MQQIYLQQIVNANAKDYQLPVKCTLHGTYELIFVNILSRMMTNVVVYVTLRQNERLNESLCF